MWIDTHTHFDDALFDKSRAELWKQANHNQVISQFIMSTSSNNWQKVTQLTKQYPNSYYALGVHPFFIFSTMKADDLKSIKQLNDLIPSLISNDECFIGLGEIGLDKKNGCSDWGHQITIFNAQLSLAKQYQLPVFIHSLKSDHDNIAYYCKNNQISKGIVHAFNGSFNQAKRFIDMGFKLGFGGMITYPKLKKLKELIIKLPLDSIVLETDTPNFPLANFNKDYSYSYQLRYLVDALIQIKHKDKLPPALLAKQLLNNVCDVFDKTSLIKQHQLFLALKSTIKK